MKNKLIVITGIFALVFIQDLLAQEFTMVPLGPEFEGVLFSSVAFSDVNNDGFPDLLMSGERESSEPLTRMFINDGLGNFTEAVNTSFEDVSHSAVAFADINNDGTEDLLITGNSNSYLPSTNLYINDGFGNFTKKTDTPFENVRGGSIAFSDINNDSYKDVLITGSNEDINITKLYLNDEGNNFVELTNTTFEGVGASSAAFSDVNNDGYSDILISGLNNQSEGSTKLYINDGLENFTEAVNTPFENVSYSSLDFSDVNNNGFEDVVITGINNSSETSTKLFINDGFGNFTEKSNTPFENIWEGFISFSDVTGNGYEDLLIAGEKSIFELTANLYINDGMGNFTEIIDFPVEGFWQNSFAFSDINDDGKNDLFITGERYSTPLVVEMYLNTIQAQKTIDFEKSWNIIDYNFNSPNYQTTQFSFQKDTVINSVEYLELYSKTDTIPSAVWLPTNTFLREDSLNRIYILENNVEKILYDFNLTANDTFSNKFGDIPCELTVYMVDTIELLNGELRKRIRLVRSDNPDPTQPWNGYKTWIQGIGSTTSLIQYGESCLTDYPYDLLCYYENEELIYTKSSNIGCFLTPVVNSENQELLSLYPNPASSSLYVKTNLNQFKISIYTFEGRLVIQSDKSDIDVSSLDPGIYLVCMKHDGGRVIKKIIVN